MFFTDVQAALYLVAGDPILTVATYTLGGALLFALTLTLLATIRRAWP